ncbi:MAG TPA: hypothetical protein IAA99_06535 [Candidatus Avibacteroides faecavium]|nr:hypothetical protein [Candidatus Avibacteroides faecavium]
MEKKPKIIIASLIAAIIVVAGVTLTLLLMERQSKQDMLQLFELEKEEMSNDYLNYAKQYDELQEVITNDSLRRLLDQEKMRVQRLLEELQSVKSSDAAEIMRLKKELQTVRAVMRNYVMQIDSLGRLNKALDDENKQLKRQNREVVSQVTTLTEEKEALTEKVTIASQLNASNITIAANNKRGRKARRIKDVTKLVFNFKIDRNPNTEPGVKTAYLRIMKPDNTVLKNANSGTFDFEDTKLTYSIRRNFEFGGDEVDMTMYWDVKEYLFEGTYRVDIFVDGNLIGYASFEL